MNHFAAGLAHGEVVLVGIAYAGEGATFLDHLRRVGAIARTRAASVAGESMPPGRGPATRLRGEAHAHVNEARAWLGG